MKPSAAKRKKKDETKGDISYGGLTQDAIYDLKDDIARLHDQMKNGFDTQSGGEPNFTQVCLDELHDDLEILQSKLNQKPSPPPQSKNSREVAKLRDIMKSLSRQLEDQQLYAGSLEHDVDVRVKQLEDELRDERRRCKKLEQENREFQLYIWRDSDRGRRR